METYQFYPPKFRSVPMDYHVLRPGAWDCDHELLDVDARDRILIQDGIVFAIFSCKHCGRQLAQSLDEVTPPATWKGRPPRQTTARTRESVFAPA